jgi:hypothetical protein
MIVKEAAIFRKNVSFAHFLSRYAFGIEGIDKIWAKKVGKALKKEYD